MDTSQSTYPTPTLNMPKFANLAEVASYFSVCSHTVRAWTKRDENPLPVAKIGHKLRFNWDEVLIWENSQKNTFKGESPNTQRAKAKDKSNAKVVSRKPAPTLKRQSKSKKKKSSG